MAQGIMPSVNASVEAERLWVLASRYGFRTDKRDPVDNQRKGSEFDFRVREFMHGHLMKDPCGDRTWGALKTILYLEGKKGGKQPWPRGRIVSNPDVNELTLVFACFFLFNGFYWPGKMDEVLKALKSELVVWLLKEFGYRLDSEHALNCPMQEWHAQDVWPIVETCNGLSVANAPDTREIEALIVSCDECPLRLKTARE
jgi:hypothetical protein